jgi:RNA polymerase sigma-70 factor (ECF subfamily)
VSSRTGDDDERRLHEAFERHAPRVFAYALRHADPASAQDVVAEVFLVAWRRVSDLPDDALPWLLVVARNTLHNRRRSRTRQQRLADDLAGLQRAAATSPGADVTAVERAAMLAALAQLSAIERDAVLLVAWDGLPTAAAASVAGCSRHAFEVRLHRARARLRRALAEDAADSDPTPPTRQEVSR